MRETGEGQEQTYAMARLPYKLKYPASRMHHLVPTSRSGRQSEFNLFPWNEQAHGAWHTHLFPNMTIQEVWSALADAHLLIFQADRELIVRQWSLPYRCHVNRSERLNMEKPHSVSGMREAWAVCFGGTDLICARRMVRYMLLCMVFGRYADDSEDVFASSWLRRILHHVDADSERSWAFRVCFGYVPRRVPLRLVKKIIRRVRSRVRAIPIR